MVCTKCGLPCHEDYNPHPSHDLAQRSPTSQPTVKPQTLWERHELGTCPESCYLCIELRRRRER